MNRRSFIAGLASIPLIGKLAPIRNLKPMFPFDPPTDGRSVVIFESKRIPNPNHGDVYLDRATGEWWGGNEKREWVKITGNSEINHL